MEKSWLLLSALLILQIPDSLQKCRVVQTVKGVPNYACNSIEELEAQENPDMFDVSIYNTDPATLIDERSLGKAPNLQIVLLDEASGGISPKAFQILKDLSRLLIRNTELGTLSKAVFENLPIKILKLDRNGISNIDRGAFANTMNLEQLYIERNQLKTIETGIFNGLTVKTLGLSKNKIQVIKKNAFGNMKNLERLHLDGNLLSEFRPDTVMDFGSNLNILWLHNNSFTEIDRNTVRGIPNLQVLNLGGNEISKIFIYTFENLLRLDTLVLSDNKLLELDADVFPPDGMPQLAKLYLNNNRLSYLTTRVLGRLRNLKGIRLGGNPWQCPCLDAILTWLSDYKVNQNCDRDYYSGSRPVCVVTDAHPNTCDYSSDVFYYYKYTEVNNKSPISPSCAL